MHMTRLTTQHAADDERERVRVRDMAHEMDVLRVRVHEMEQERVKERREYETVTTQVEGLQKQVEQYKQVCRMRGKRAHMCMSASRLHEQSRHAHMSCHGMLMCM